jgi:hypothetical protein
MKIGESWNSSGRFGEASLEPSQSHLHPQVPHISSRYYQVVLELKSSPSEGAALDRIIARLEYRQSRSHDSYF